MPDQTKCISLLSRTYRIPAHYSFYILRNSFKQVHEMDEEEFRLMVHVYSSVFDETLKIKKELCEKDH